MWNTLNWGTKTAMIIAGIGIFFLFLALLCLMTAIPYNADMPLIGKLFMGFGLSCLPLNFIFLGIGVMLPEKEVKKK